MKNNDFAMGTGEPDGRPCQGTLAILVTGIPASGKSVLAERLSAELGLPWFSKDRIKEELYEGYLILENNFEESSKPGLVRLLERYGYRALTLRLTGDYACIYEHIS